MDAITIIERALTDYIDVCGEDRWLTFNDVGAGEGTEWFVRTTDDPPRLSITGMACAVIAALRKEGIAV